MNKFRIPEGVTLTIVDGDVETGLRNDPAFYVVGGMNTVAIISANGDDLFSVCCIGEMRLDLPDGKVLRYASDLPYENIETDNDLYSIDGECWSNNAWFEIFDEEAGGGSLGEICHDVADAIQYALDLAEEIVSPPKKIPASPEVRAMEVREMGATLAGNFMPDYLRCEQCGDGPNQLTEVDNGIGTWVCSNCGNVSYGYDLD